MLMPVPALFPDAADRLAAVHELAVEIPPRVADALSRPAQALARVPDGLPRMAQPVHKARFFLADAGVDLALGDLLRRLALNALRLLALPCQLREPVQIAPDRRGVVLDSFLCALLRHVPEALFRSPLELRDEIQQIVLRFAVLADGKLLLGILLQVLLPLWKCVALGILRSVNPVSRFFPLDICPEVAYIIGEVNVPHGPLRIGRRAPSEEHLASFFVQMQKPSFCGCLHNIVGESTSIEAGYYFVGFNTLTLQARFCV